MTRQSSYKRNVIVGEDNIDAFAERINVAVNRAGGVKNLADKMGMSTSVLRSWRSGNSDPSRLSLIKMAEAGGVDLAWLASGVGSPDGATASHDVLTPDLALLEEVIAKTERMLSARRASVKPEAKAKVIRLIYEYCLRQGRQMDEASMNNIIELAAYRAAG